MQTNFVHFKKRDKKGRRLSIFAEVVPETGKQLHIWVYTCSLEDSFSKAKGYELHLHFLAYGDVKTKPKEFLIPIVDDKPLKSFINWANDTFYTYTVLEVAATLQIIWRKVGEEIEAYEVGKTEVIKVIDNK